MVSPATSRVPARRAVQLAATQQLPPRPGSWGREATALLAAGVGGFGAAPLLHHPALAVPALGVGAVAGAARAVLGVRAQTRLQLADRLAEALAPALGLRAPNRRAVQLRVWSSGWPGVPRRVDLRYAPGVDDTDPGWRAELVAAVGRRLLADYQVARHDRRRCRLRLTWRPPVAAGGPPPAVQVRAERTVTELLGPTAVVTGVRWSEQDLTGLDVRHQAGAKLAASGYRHRVERVVSTMLPGRWRARWDLEADTVTFEVRPAFPASVWLPVEPVDPDQDLLTGYDELRIAYGVDEDAEVMHWRPPQDPHVMLVGTTGSGKALALDTPVPTPSGWTTMGELTAGAVVYDEQGAACTVLAAHPVRHGRPCYRVTFSDGSTIVADADHLWLTSTRAERVSAAVHERRVRSANARPRRMTIGQLEILDEVITASRTDEQISIPEAARLVGIRPSAGILRQLSRTVAVSGERPRPDCDFVYREQVVQQVQTVNVYPRAQLLQQLVAECGSGRHQNAWPDPQILEDLAAASRPKETINTSALRQLLGVKYSTVQMLLHSADVQPVRRRETMPRRIPAHTQGRRVLGPPVRLYPKRQLLEELARWGSGRPRDGKDRMPGAGVRTTEQIAATMRSSDGHANHSVPVASPIEGVEAVLPLAPYALGVWLGDGHSWSGEFTSADPEVAAHLQTAGVDVRDRGCPSSQRPSYQARVYTMLSPVRRQLDELGLLRGPAPAVRDRTKHIPNQYLRASIDQRKALLAGLMDTDGTVNPAGTCQFTNTTEQLAQDVHELACSLGYRATIRPGRAKLDGRDCGPKWTVAWTTTGRVFQLERKHLAHKERTARSCLHRLQQRYVVAVDPVEPVPVRCITVDSPNHLYLVGRTFIPTHNTVAAHTLLVQVTRRGWPVWVVDGKSVEFLGFQDWPNVQIVATSIEQQIAVITRAWEVMEHRYQLVTSGRARETDFEPLLVFLDEFADFRGNLLAWYAEIKVKGDPTAPPVLSRVASLARKGRTSRVHLIFGTQRPDATYFGTGSGGQSGDMRDNFRMRISLGRLSPQGALMMWESPAIGTSIPRGCRGRATTINEANRPVEIQTYRTPDPRKVAAGSAEEQLLERLRPPVVRHERLLILPPELDSDLDSGELPEPTYSDYAAARWVFASQRPDLDPVLHRQEEGPDGRELSSPMAVFGLRVVGNLPDDSTNPSAQPDGTAGEHLTVPLPRLTVVPDLDREDPDDGADPAGPAGPDGYGPPAHLPVAELQVGDLVLVDQDNGEWGVVDQEVEPDLADPGCLAVSWRSDDDDCGLLSVPDDQLLPARRPLELTAQP